MHKGRTIAFVALTAALTVAALWRPADRGLSPCVSKNLFRVSCPGCGMTRAVTAAARGEVVASLRHHALALPVLAAAVLSWALLLAGLVVDRNYFPDLTRPYWTWVVVGWFVVMIGYWLIRLATGTTPP